MDEVEEGVVEVLREVFAQPDLVVLPSTTAGDVDGWDSLAHLNVLFSLESRFGVQFTDTEMGSIQDVGELTSSIRTKLG
ncbi:acyl carrier protein [Cellulosimicrobium arenosum]|uniref:Acyl carrier protein n=1 Tax=Cellulosimicrobium arenosum TaxID=2708133 RepID=A0A927IZ01_9MICO|nr:acyl carrier protein [Cellulosimicrobium arenosum]MBD8078951.1 acyl carrier protein [Cellulosimicrobium arenosum]